MITPLDLFCAVCGGAVSTMQAWRSGMAKVYPVHADCHEELQWRYTASMLGKDASRKAYYEHLEAKLLAEGKA